MSSLKDKVICVTGSASGIGLATAKLFARGAKLSLLDLRQEFLDSAVVEILGCSPEQPASGQILTTAADIHRSNQVSMRGFRRLSILSGIWTVRPTSRE